MFLNLLLMIAVATVFGFVCALPSRLYFVKQYLNQDIRRFWPALLTVSVLVFLIFYLGLTYLGTNIGLAFGCPIIFDSFSTEPVVPSRPASGSFYQQSNFTADRFYLCDMGSEEEQALFVRELWLHQAFPVLTDNRCFVNESSICEAVRLTVIGFGKPSVLLPVLLGISNALVFAFTVWFNARGGDQRKRKEAL